jgi:hypothetical protein
MLSAGLPRQQEEENGTPSPLFFFMSDGGDVFPCIETRGVNLYA